VLEDVRVIDLTRVLAGPYCTQILGDLGADVIKIEEPGTGDEVRTISPRYPGGESHYFLSLNRNKRSVVVDLKSPDGREFILGLVAEADIVIENFRPGVLDRLGLGLEDLRAVKPDVILCSITGYGSVGPLSGSPSFDLVMQARSGAMAINGDPDRPPTKLGLPMGDLGGGLWGTIALLAALRQRDNHAGDGPAEAQHVDVSLLDGLLAMQGYLGQLAMLTGESPPRVGSDHHTVVPWGRFEAADGYLVIAVLIPRFWRKLCESIERPDLADDPRFATNTDRHEHREELGEILNEILRGKTRAEWDEIFSAADVPHGPVLEVTEALAQEQVAARGLITSAEHPTAGEVPLVGSPVRINGRAPRDDVRAAPLYGADTRTVAAEVLGLRPAEIDELIAAGVLAESGSRAEPEGG
jgi:crotonobetainyl-CoA:carnitine CoA-transferase CaiB-like acyl-CoA transferase